MDQPLCDTRVLDFSTLLPGPLCTLLLAEAGAEVIKVERPGRGDEMRAYEPRLGADSVNFGLLNRGKKSIMLDLKSEEGRVKILDLVAQADVLVEQFRPGVMKRLGFGYEEMEQINPGLIYCSITGYGQSGPKTHKAGHDLNYLADSGMLSRSRGVDEAPVLPPALIADIAGGAYPAAMNILLALKQREMTQRGSWIDVSMADNLFTFMYEALGEGWAGQGWTKPGNALTTGGTARYQIYKTSDDQYLAAAPLEEKFWRNFATALGAPELVDPKLTPEEATRRIAEIIRSRPAAWWLARLGEADTCTARIVDLKEAVDDPHFVSRGLFDRKVRFSNGEVIPALPVPIVGMFRSAESVLPTPALGADNEHGKFSRKIEEDQ